MSKYLYVKAFSIVLLLGLFCTGVNAQVADSSFHQSKDTIYLAPEDTFFIRPIIVDTVLRIKNFTPYFTLHVDSTLDYQFVTNKDPSEYYWYLKNSPVGLRINKDNGILHFKAEKSFFLSGKLKYDTDYKVVLGVQNLNDPKDHLDTTFKLLFYNTDIIPSKIKPTVSSYVTIDEGDTISFRLQCDEGSFPIESITYFSNLPIRSSTPIAVCGDNFTWIAPFDFIKPEEKLKQKDLILKFIGTDKFFNHDTTVVTVTVNESVDYARRLLEYNQIESTTQDYILQLKSTFRYLDRKIKNTKNTRTTFELSSATTALGGTVFSSMQGQDLHTVGKILPSVGVALVPVKEAVAPNKNDELNAASLVRNDIKRLQYLVSNNTLIGDKDPDIVTKIGKIKEGLQQVQLQLIEVTLVNENVNRKELDEYFNNPKVNKKYRLKSK